MLELNLRIKQRKRLVHDKPEPINQVWSMGFMPWPVGRGAQLQTVNVIDDFSREPLGLEIDFSLPSGRVIWEPCQIISWSGKPSNEIRIQI